MEDSTAMTIEFLRARLLSERSISRSARQRADELAEKVMELEEQLRVVTLQRKLAEKATVDVLAILENHGMSDASEEFDLGSDLEMPSESDVNNDSTKGGERSTSSEGRRHGLDELSGSDVDSSPAPGRSLSWKGRLYSPRSLENYKTCNVRRRSSFSSITSSPKHRLGKSCRQIRHRESRSVVEESRDKPVNCQENEVVSSSEGFPNCSDEGSNIQRIESKIQEEDESEVMLANKNHDVDGFERKKDMEKALEHQARLIGQYEAMEKAQNEWEEKFRENNSSTPDSCDLGNHSDITEERDESKAKTTCSARVVTSNAQEDKSEARGVFLSGEMLKAEPRDNMPKSYDDTGHNNQKSITVSPTGLLGQENSHSLLKGNQNKSPENCRSQPSDRHQLGPYRNDSPDSKPTDSFSTDVYGSLPLKDASRNKSDLYELVSQGQSRESSGILESLKQAKLSLQQEINRLPVAEGGYTGKAIKPLAPVSKTEDRFDIPVGCKGLFRVPTDFSDEATARLNVPDPASRFSPNFSLDRGISETSGGQFGTNPCSGTMLSFSPDNQSLATRYLESQSRFEAIARLNVPDPTSRFSPNFYLDRGISRTSGYPGTMLSFSQDNQSLATRYSESRFDTEKAPFSNGVLSSSKNMYPTYPIYSSYQNATPPMSFGDGLSRPYSSSTVGVPPAYNFSFRGDHVR